MRELERILQEGFDRIDKAIDEVKRKYDFMLWSDGICDDTPIIQRHLDERGVIALPEGVFAIYKPLQLKEGRRIEGRSASKTKISVKF